MLPIIVEAISWRTRPVASQLVTLVTYVKYLNFDMIINIEKWKKIDARRKERHVNWMKDFEVNSVALLKV